MAWTEVGVSDTLCDIGFGLLFLPSGCPWSCWFDTSGWGWLSAELPEDRAILVQASQTPPGVPGHFRYLRLLSASRQTSET